MREKIFTIEDVIEDSWKENYKGKMLVLDIEFLHPKHRTPDNQLVRAIDGFGCDPSKLGTAVFGEFINDGERARFKRNDFLGILKDEIKEELNL